MTSLGSRCIALGCVGTGRTQRVKGENALETQRVAECSGLSYVGIDFPGD